MDSNERKAMVAASSAIGVLAFFGAGVILYVIFFRKKGSLRTPSNLLIANLSFADLIKSVPGTTPMYGLRVLGYFSDPNLCLFAQGWFMSALEVALFTHIALTVERFMAVAHPYSYVRFFGKKMVAGMVAATWILAVMLWIVVPFNWNSGPKKVQNCGWPFIVSDEFIIYINFLIGMLLPLVIIFLAYTRITVIALKHLIQMRKQVNVLPDPDTEGSSPNIQFKKTTSELKTTFRCFVVVIVYIICQVPQRIVALMLVTGHTVNIPANALVTLMTAHSLANPFLYAYSSQNLRKEILVMIRGCLPGTCHRIQDQDHGNI